MASHCKRVTTAVLGLLPHSLVWSPPKNYSCGCTCEKEEANGTLFFLLIPHTLESSSQPHHFFSCEKANTGTLFLITSLSLLSTDCPQSHLPPVWPGHLPNRKDTLIAENKFNKGNLSAIISREVKKWTVMENELFNTNATSSKVMVMKETVKKSLGAACYPTDIICVWYHQASLAMIFLLIHISSNPLWWKVLFLKHYIHKLC